MTAVSLIAVIGAGILGLVVGSFLNVVIYRVPAGIPLTRDSRCPSCDAPVRWWMNVPVLSWMFLGGKCAKCRTHISARYPLVEAITGVSFALVTWYALHFGDWPYWSVVPVVVAYAVFVAASISLVMIDLDVRRLPTPIVVPAGITGLALFTLACLLGAAWLDLLRAGIGATLLYLAYELMRTIYPKGMGGGDVRLAGLIGLYLGWIGWGALVVGAFAAFLLAGIYSLALLALRKAGRKTAVAFGPWMIAGAWLGIVLGEPVARWYLHIAVG
jgi:leader peptidase (prepilin peptidase) / N-methyltransferase